MRNKQQIKDEKHEWACLCVKERKQTEEKKNGGDEGTKERKTGGQEKRKERTKKKNEREGKR